MLISNDAATADPVVGQQRRVRQPAEVEITDLVKQHLEIGMTAQSYFKNEPMPLQRNYSFTALFHACLETLGSCALGRWGSMTPFESN